MSASDISTLAQPAGIASRILLVTGDAPIQHALAALLREHELLICADPEAAPAAAVRSDVDTIICHQRVPPASGIAVLREIRRAHPRAMCLLLCDRPDPRLLLEAINEVEVFRLIDLPWDNTGLRGAVADAARGGRALPVLGSEPPTLDETDSLKRHVSLVVVDRDADAQQRLRDVLQPVYKLHFAAGFDRALQFMEQHETGTLVFATRAGDGEIMAPLKALKRSHPQVTTIAIDGQNDTDLALELINELKVFRVLRRPLQPTLCRQYADAAMARYWRIKHNPQAAWRVIPAAGARQESTQSLPAALLNRIRGLPGRLIETDAR